VQVDQDTSKRVGARMRLSQLSRSLNPKLAEVQGVMKAAAVNQSGGQEQQQVQCLDQWRWSLGYKRREVRHKE
jgi:hypothetical protein